MDSGFQEQKILTAEIPSSHPHYAYDVKCKRLYLEVVAKLATEPGVVSAGPISLLPLEGQLWAEVILVPGDTQPRAS